MFEYAATVLSVHDGDTATFNIDLGFDVHVIHPLRFDGINAPELATPEGKAAKAYIDTLLRPGDVVTVATSKAQWDKYGRYLGTITRPGDTVTVNQQLIDAGHAKPWTGQGAKPV